MVTKLVATMIKHPKTSAYDCSDQSFNNGYGDKMHFNNLFSNFWFIFILVQFGDDIVFDDFNIGWVVLTIDGIDLTFSYLKLPWLDGN